eukprot:1156136-Pelagomonas_calceolata.AAC.5
MALEGLPLGGGNGWVVLCMYVCACASNVCLALEACLSAEAMGARKTACFEHLSFCPLWLSRKANSEKRKGSSLQPIRCCFVQCNPGHWGVVDRAVATGAFYFNVLPRTGQNVNERLLERWCVSGAAHQQSPVASLFAPYLLVALTPSSSGHG